MTDTELKSCIGTIEMLRRSAYNMYGVIDVIDSDNCEKIIKVLSDIPKYKDAYNKGWDDGAKATNVDCGVVWEERIDAIKADIMRYEADCMLTAEGKLCKGCTDDVFRSIERIIDKHCGGDTE